MLVLCVVPCGWDVGDWAVCCRVCAKVYIFDMIIANILVYRVRFA